MSRLDRVSEVYKDEHDPSHERTRRRIHWMCDQVKGRALDLGCSQGIATILMANRGIDAVGVDVEISALEYATTDARTEPARSKASFVCASGTALPYPDSSFDTVVMGEILEHLPDPVAVVGEAARVLQPDGRVVLTVPFGYHPHPDHRHTFYLASLLHTIRSVFSPETIEIVDNYLHVVARRGALTDDERRRWLVSLQPSMEEAMLALERRLYQRNERLADSLQRHRARVSTLTDERTRLEEQVLALESRLRRMEAGRWWRLRGLLLEARRKPRRWLRFPIDFVRLARPSAGSRDSNRRRARASLRRP